MTELELLLRSGVSFKQFSNEYLIPLSDAPVFVETCRALDVPILGADAFRIRGEQRQPLMTFDMLTGGWTEGTREEWARRTCDETLLFLKSVTEPELSYVFVLGHPVES